MIHDSKFKILVVVGPTSSGKSELAVKLAKRFKGEIISCDSRQVYKGMDLGTGKVTGRWIASSHPERTERFLKSKRFIYKSIPHHLIDFQNPARQYSVARFQREAKKIIADIVKRGHLPILCGGTMHWIDAVVYNQILPEVKPNFKLRQKLEKQSADILFKRLKKLDPVRAKTIDRFNKRRLIRALEIIISTGKPVVPLGTILSDPDASGESKGLLSSTLWLGITLPQTDLYKKIEKRLHERLKQGMINEVKKLHQSSPPQELRKGGGRGRKGLSWKKLESFGLEYKYISLFLQKRIPYDEMIVQLSYAIKHYSKRQMTWWKKNKEIIWIKPDVNKAIKLTTKFLKK